MEYEEPVGFVMSADVDQGLRLWAWGRRPSLNVAGDRSLQLDQVCTSVRSDHVIDSSRSIPVNWVTNQSTSDSLNTPREATCEEIEIERLVVDEVGLSRTYRSICT